MYFGHEVHINGIGRPLGRPEGRVTDQTSAANARRPASAEFGSIDDGPCTGDASLGKSAYKLMHWFPRGDTTHTYMGLARGFGIVVSKSPRVSDDRRTVPHAVR
jgi:hypothetical protein